MPNKVKTGKEKELAEAKLSFEEIRELREDEVRVKR